MKILDREFVLRVPQAGQLPGGNDTQKRQHTQQHHGCAQAGVARPSYRSTAALISSGVAEVAASTSSCGWNEDDVAPMVRAEVITRSHPTARCAAPTRRAVATAVAALSLLAAACQPGARAGSLCRTSDFGDDGTYVMKCVNKRWQRVATQAQVAQLIARLLAQRATTSTFPQPGSATNSILPPPVPTTPGAELADGPPDPLSLSASWLEAVNYYRLGSGLAPVVEETTWSAGIVSHLVYLRDTPSEFRTGEFASAHTENPASPLYTLAGAAAGQSSNLGLSSSDRSDRSAIDRWMAAPFHAIGILRPRLARSAFGSLGGSAGLDVIRGLGTSAGPAVTTLFPGNGSTIRMRSASPESPDPLESCPGYTSGAGTPLVAMLPYDPPSAGITASVILPSGVTIGGADVCVVSEDTFVSTDAIYGPTGRSILDTSNALLIIPRRSLTGGRHSVTVNVPGRAAISWSFDVARRS